MVDRKAGTRKVGIHRHALSSSRSNDTAVRKKTTITPFRILTNSFLIQGHEIVFPISKHTYSVFSGSGSQDFISGSG
jgi:hypothetical protein